MLFELKIISFVSIFITLIAHAQRNEIFFITEFLFCAALFCFCLFINSI